ncbi:hypothetical protein ZWY2020_026781 [Hordeum vulgare]|nr:hypothetical protein ZWY2020_026781 [Hordeum vulgare]
MPLSLHWMNNILWLPIPVIQQIMIRFEMVGTHLTRRTLIILLPLKILNLLYGIYPKRLRENGALSSFFKILTTSPHENGEGRHIETQLQDQSVQTNPLGNDRFYTPRNVSTRMIVNLAGYIGRGLSIYSWSRQEGYNHDQRVEVSLSHKHPRRSFHIKCKAR